MSRENCQNSLLLDLSCLALNPPTIMACSSQRYESLDIQNPGTAERNVDQPKKSANSRLVRPSQKCENEFSRVLIFNFRHHNVINSFFFFFKKKPGVLSEGAPFFLKKKPSLSTTGIQRRTGQDRMSLVLSEGSPLSATWALIWPSTSSIHY